MTLAADRWPEFTGAAAGSRSGAGMLTVWRLELVKLGGQFRVRAIAVLCLVTPFLAAGVFRVQNSAPGDTLFGQWVHASGFAIPMVILGFSGQWILPVLTAVVAGDIFSAEDHFGTWKTVLTRSRTRGQLFAAKFAAALTFAVAAVLLLTASDLVSGLLAGTQPVVGVSGQLVPAGQATELVIASWASQLPPVLGFTALAVLLSVLSRNSAVGMGGPVLIVLALQVVTLVSLPASVQSLLLSTPFGAWHGFWAQAPFYRPFWSGLITCAGWFAVCGGLSWLIFRRRTIGAP